MTDDAGQPRRFDLRRIRGVVFDCDGVLFDSRDVNRHYYNHIRAALGLAPMSREDEEYSFMHTVDMAMARIIPEELLPDAARVQGRMTYDDFIDRMVPEPGLLELLVVLEKMGVRMAVNTNRKNSMEMVLERFDLTHFFHPVMTAAKVALPKPDPEGLRRIVETWGLPACEMSYLGDSSVDQETTDRAEVPFWAYRNRDLRAQLHVDSFHELRQWFETGFCEIID
ncbi:MAG: HAD family hydrolase [Deltaproteobacteria bacterium HGW-Deltaproteobacteria-18]|jgi:phosphoglycolate phosphatase-like HAD superfamily hydrolase|nr:MAG: HAD family hydrolase [Deltaproteobacteria bacterium HGW-Deltaproteobacteria-18]